MTTDRSRFKIPHTSSTNNVTTTVGVSEFVKGFVRRHVAPNQRSQADIFQSGVSYNLNLLPQSTCLKRDAGRKRSHKLGPMTSGCRVVQRRRHRQKVKPFDQIPNAHREIPANLPGKLNNLWQSYASTAIKWSRLNEEIDKTPLSNSSLTNNVEIALRMNLIGARLNIVRSISTSLAGRTGTVVMETKHTFRMVLQPLAQTSHPRTTATLTMVPKVGTLFALIPPSAGTTPSLLLLLNGDQLLHRPIDRAVRKWRRPVEKTPLTEVRQMRVTTGKLMLDLLAD